MSDPVLSSLCTICHAAPPKYKCPRCKARTCSLPCSLKHKARASCSGARDPSAYVAPAQLRTPAGFDHDYNFLHGIEVARARVEKEIIEQREILREEELRPSDGDAKHFDKVWYGDELRHVPIYDSARARYGSSSGSAPPQVVLGFEKHIRRRVRALNIELLTMPKGMARHRENKTAWNRRTNTIYWQVEWLLFDSTSGTSPRRILHKALDGVPVSQALAGSLEWQRQGTLKRQREEADPADDDKEPARKKKRKASKLNASYAQVFSTSSWDLSEYTLQSFYSAQWDHVSSVASVPHTVDDEALRLARWQFFLHKADRPKQLIPMASTESLATALAGRMVIEFPTIYVLSPSASLPEGFSVVSSECKKVPVATGDGEGSTRPRLVDPNPKGRAVRQEQWQGSRRQPRLYPQRGRERRTFQTVYNGAEDLEEGEINSDQGDREEVTRPMADARPGNEAPEERSSKSVWKAGNGLEDSRQPVLKPGRGLVDYASSDSA